MGTVNDSRTLAWFSITKEARALIRATFEGRKVAAALNVYAAFCEAANDERARGEAFAKPRSEIAHLAGVTLRSVDEYTGELERVGLLEVQRVSIEGRNFANQWTLIDPPPRDQWPTNGGGEAHAGDAPKTGSAVANGAQGGAADDTTPPAAGAPPIQEGGQEASVSSAGGGASDPSSLPGLGEQNGSAGTTGSKRKPAGVDPDSMPDDFPAELRDTLDAVMGKLRSIAEAKGAKRVPKGGIARVMAARPLKDHRKAVADFETWWLFGKGATKSLNDVVQAFRNWLENCDDIEGGAKPPGERPTPVPSGHDATRDRRSAALARVTSGQQAEPALTGLPGGGEG